MDDFTIFLSTILKILFIYLHGLHGTFFMDNYDIFAFPTHHHKIHLPYTTFDKHGENQQYEPPHRRTASSQE